MAQVTQTTAQIQAILNNSILNPMTDAGDLVVGVTNSTPTRLTKGTPGQTLAVNDSLTGVEWSGESHASTMTVDVILHEGPAAFVDPTITAAQLYAAVAGGTRVVIKNEYGTTHPLIMATLLPSSTSPAYGLMFQVVWYDAISTVSIQGTDDPTTTEILANDVSW